MGACGGVGTPVHPELVVVLLCTVTLMLADRALLAPSTERASSVWRPSATCVVSNAQFHGALSSRLRNRPSTKKSTAATPTSSVASASHCATGRTPLTVAPSSGV